METIPTSNRTTPRSPDDNGNKISFVDRFSLAIKLIVIGILTMLLLIPLAMIRGVINERKFTKNNAIKEITAKWSGEQIVTGPCIAIPYQQERVIHDKKEIIVNDILLFPASLTINADANVEKRRRGIYDASVYKSEIVFTGVFDMGEIMKAGIKEENILFDNVRVIMGVSDLKGIREKVSLQLNGRSFTMEPGIPVNNLFTGPNPDIYISAQEERVGVPNIASGIFTSGLHMRADTTISKIGNQVNIPFTVSMQLNGSMGLFVLPIGKETTVEFRSNWTIPSFGGDFLPVSHEINDNGFIANWKVLHLNRSYGQVVTADDGSAINQVASSLFGVKFIQSVDQYQQNLRSVKYAVLIILLTFVVVLFIELIKKNPVNPFHYLLVGLALVLYYSLLLSISEIWGFNLAYLIAALMTVVMITLHMVAILKNRKQGFLVGSLLAFLYLFVFLLIRMESYSLLVGSLGLFVILGVIMFFARKIKG